MSQAEDLRKRRVQRNFARAAPDYEGSAIVSAEVSQRMLERLELVQLEPRRVLDIGSGTGIAARALAERYHPEQLIALDLSLPMLRQHSDRRSWRQAWRSQRAARICADFERLPVRSGGLDLVISNLALHWTTQPARVFAEVSRVLRVGGLFMFTTFGPDTLKELARAAAEHADTSPVHAFVDMHDLGDALVASGLSDPVMEMEYLTLTYERLDGLLHDLKRSGGMSTRATFAGLRTPRWRERIAQRYEPFRRDGRLPATFELVYGHAWKAQRRSAQTEDGRAVIQFEPRRRKM
jgi:malonyl-CoA O-methyltransferase